ncbi:MAG TPA: hypothetical protein PKY82_28960 [Pyrinomonadaceae bacterium]|nr:hypothetical protein [Pyrinomonadaceae bacterium]
MRNKTSITNKLLVLFTFTLVVMGCQIPNVNKLIKFFGTKHISNNILTKSLIGKWEVQSFTQKFRIIFNLDATYTENEDNGASETGTYSVIDNETVVFQSPVDGKVTVKFLINNNSMSWTNAKGDTIYGERQNSQN